MPSSSLYGVQACTGRNTHAHKVKKNNISKDKTRAAHKHSPTPCTFMTQGLDQAHIFFLSGEVEGKGNSLQEVQPVVAVAVAAVFPL